MKLNNFIVTRCCGNKSITYFQGEGNVGRRRTELLYFPEFVYLFYDKKGVKKTHEYIKGNDPVIGHLCMSGVKLRVFNTYRRPDLLKKYKIKKTPIYVTYKKPKGKPAEIKYYRYLLQPLKENLLYDTYGRTLLHRIGYSQGRDAGRKIKKKYAKLSPDDLDKTVKRLFSQYGINEFQIHDFDPKKKNIEVSIIPIPFTEKTKMGEKDVPYYIIEESFLRGFFLEISGNNILLKATKSRPENNECIFKT